MLELDHLCLLSSNLAADAEAVAMLGLELEPLGRHPSLGSWNRLAMLRRTYLELLGVERSTEHTAFYEACLRDDRRPVGLALRGAAIQAYQDLSARGVPVSPPLSFSRPVDLEQGSAVAHFTIVKIDPDFTPGAFVFVCEHHTPELVWRRPPAHDNGWLDISGLHFVCADPAGVAERYALLFGVSVEAEERGFRLRLGETTINFLTRKSAPLSAVRSGIGAGCELAGIEFVGLRSSAGWQTWPDDRLAWRSRPARDD